jgi:hypothetical protein
MWQNSHETRIFEGESIDNGEGTGVCDETTIECGTSEFDFISGLSCMFKELSNDEEDDATD